MSASAGWYPDPGGGQGLYRYWDGRVWSAATTTNPASAPPAQGLVHTGSTLPGSAQGGSVGTQPVVPAATPYAQYQATAGRKRSAAGWWVAGAALVVVIVVVAVIAIRAVAGGSTPVSGLPGGQDTGSVCPPQQSSSSTAAPAPADGRVHGGPLSFPMLGAPWGAPRPEDRVPFGVDVLSQEVGVESNYDGRGSGWVASVLVGELQAGDGFFTPEQGSQIVVRCILGKFYGNNPVQSDVKVNRAATIDGHDAWIVESQLSFDIPGLQTKGELLLVAIVAASEESSGLYYASIPDSTPQLVEPARDALKQLKVDG